MPTAVIPEKTKIQEISGCRIKSGMTDFTYLIAGLRLHGGNE